MDTESDLRRGKKIFFRLPKKQWRGEAAEYKKTEALNRDIDDLIATFK